MRIRWSEVVVFVVCRGHFVVVIVDDVVVVVVVVVFLKKSKSFIKDENCQ